MLEPRSRFGVASRDPESESLLQRETLVVARNADVGGERGDEILHLPADVGVPRDRVARAQDIRDLRLCRIECGKDSGGRFSHR